MLKDTFTIKQIKQVLENKNFDNTKIHNIVIFMENKSLIKYQSTDVNGFEIYEKSENYLSDIEKIKQDPQNLPETLTLEDIDIQLLFLNINTNKIVELFFFFIKISSLLDRAYKELVIFSIHCC